MTGNDVFERVSNLLGYSNLHTVRTDKEKLLKRAHEIINQICLDLKIPQINRLSDEISTNRLSLDALCYGTAMLFSLIEGDGKMNKIFTDIYNAKRSAALSKKDIIDDKLPTVSYGVD